MDALAEGDVGIRVALYLDDPSLDRWWQETGRTIAPEDRIARLLEQFSRQDPRPVVLLLDELDALIGDTLIALLRQLRAGYTQRPEHFPQTVMLCGVRDLRDYRIHSTSQAAIITGGSAFNIKAKSLRLGDFDRDDVSRLLGQHQGETGQAFTAEAIERVWYLTRGQPWLVNAL